MIAVTGIGAVCALGEDASAIFDAICAGTTGIRDGSPWEGIGPTARREGRPTGSDLALQAVAQAVAGYPQRDGLAVVGASTAGDMLLGEEAYGAYALGRPIPQPEHFLYAQLCHRPTRRVADALGARGPVLTTSTACTSGALSIGVAADLLRLGRADAAVVFGTDALCRTTLYGFSSLGLHSPTGCRPFDDARDGMSLGEGAAALLLERADDARNRGVRPLAEVRGWSSAQDAHHLSTPHPHGRGAIQAMRGALREAGVQAVDYVNAHGTGTRLNDEVEAAALQEVLPGVAVSSTKGSTGHTLGAAGALEAVITVLALQHGRLPPTVGLRSHPWDLDLPTRPREVDLRVAMTVNLAFGGHNTAVVLGRPA